MCFVNMFWILLPVFLTAFVLEVLLEVEVFLVPLLFPGYQIQGLQGGILGLGYGVHQGEITSKVFVLQKPTFSATSLKPLDNGKPKGYL